MKIYILNQIQDWELNMIDYILDKIQKTEIKENPFEHMFINNIFPDNYFKELLKNLPKKNDYIAINKTGAVKSSYSAERYVFNLNYESIGKLENTRKNTLNELLKVFTSPIFFNEVCKVFQKTLINRISNFSDYEKETFGQKNFQYSIKSSLVKDLQKYKLGVHTDTVNKLLTFLFYIPKDNSYSNLGTTLYTPKKGVDIHIGEKGNYHASLTETENNFDVVTTLPFIPNSLLLFPRSNQSFHGVEEINSEGFERNLIQLNYYFKPKSK